ncbi:putative nepenthesin [Dioscorea sansibarensis]
MICCCIPAGTVEGTTILEMKLTKPREEDVMKFLVSDDARVSSLQFRIRNGSDVSAQEGSSMEVQIPLSSGVKLQTLNYVVAVELGGKKMTVIVDTGSDLTWVQCKPCTSCHYQQDPVFDPSASHSYRNIPCNSPTCDSLTLATGNSGVCSTDKQSCSYSLSYGDGSYSHGVLSSESINLGGTLVKNFIFGCGESNQGLFGGTSGLMGLGRAQLSLVSQTAFQFGGVFSYCLPASGLSNGRILIDSGTVITRLVPSIYRALRDEFVKQFSGFPPAPAFSILDTCFNLTGYKEVSVPTLRLQFEGDVEVDIDATGVLYFVRKDASQVCLALATLLYEDETTIFGNYQQKNLRIVYDTAGNRLGFAEEACGYN